MRRRNGSRFGSGGIEIDKTASSSPRGTQVLAEIPNLFGPGFTAQMTYYRTGSGAEVFAAGAVRLTGDLVTNRVVKRVVVNLWAHMTAPV